MKRTLYLKLLLSYFIYGIVAFIIICTFTQRLTSRYMEKQEASQLYREASIIASDYATEYFKSSMSLNDFQNHMEIISDYMTAEVWVVSPDGEILLDSSDPEIGKRSNDTGAGSSPYIIKDFDNSVAKTDSLLELAKECKDNGLKVTLVGIERKEQVELIKGNENVDALQGYYFYKPLELNDFIQEVRQNSLKASR